ncbi:MULTISPECIES: HAD family phosphatase [unclassified Streptomyces]|uniref:HAD family hydrolase n=1 Tax=unclassified Streptomyces TaxID=2593676 RepID=UPI0008DD8F59|nr:MULTISPECIES: HAD family phosphatase [unclassified Streptomyces]OII67320.1 haloacid dehalogenase [Streptomyces sp. CC77]
MPLPMIWFDFGGVLSPPLDDLYDAYHRKTGIPPAYLQAAMKEVASEMGVPTLAPIETAALTEAEWGSRLRRVLTARHPGLDLGRARLETFGEQWFDGVTANPVMVCALRYARDNGFRVGILSNNVVEWEPYWTAIVAPAGEVDCLIDSCRAGVRKPDPAIFDLAAKTAGAAPEDCVLVDDLAENCAAARGQGWRTVHFRDNHQTLHDLRQLTGLPSIL